MVCSWTALVGSGILHGRLLWIFRASGACPFMQRRIVAEGTGCFQCKLCIWSTFFVVVQANTSWPFLLTVLTICDRRWACEGQFALAQRCNIGTVCGLIFLSTEFCLIIIIVCFSIFDGFLMMIATHVGSRYLVELSSWMSKMCLSFTCIFWLYFLKLPVYFHWLEWMESRWR